MLVRKCCRLSSLAKEARTQVRSMIWGKLIFQSWSSILTTFYLWLRSHLRTSLRTIFEQGISKLQTSKTLGKIDNFPTNLKLICQIWNHTCLSTFFSRSWFVSVLLDDICMILDLDSSFIPKQENKWCLEVEWSYFGKGNNSAWTRGINFWIND